MDSWWKFWSRGVILLRKLSVMWPAMTSKKDYCGEAFQWSFRPLRLCSSYDQRRAHTHTWTQRGKKVESESWAGAGGGSRDRGRHHHHTVWAGRYNFRSIYVPERGHWGRSSWSTILRYNNVAFQIVSSTKKKLEVQSWLEKNVINLDLWRQ